MMPLSPMEVLQALHTGHGGVVTLHVKRQDGKFLDVASVPADQLRQQLPFIATHLKQDAYFSINSTYEQRHSRTSDFGFTVYSRREKHLKWLNAIALDLDAGHGIEGFSITRLREQFLGEIEAAKLPVPSMICESGRGLWALWMLKDHREAGRVTAHERCRTWHKRIGQAIARRFAHLDADIRAHDCSRIMRFPGSTNSNASHENAVVTFFRMSDAEYTLPELGPYFGVVPRKTSLAPQKGPRDTAKQAGGFARWRNALEGFRQLWALRGGFNQGHRHNAIYLLAALLRYNRADADKITQECLKLAEACTPPVPFDEATKRIEASRKVRSRLRHDTFVRMLGITPEEVGQLPIWFKPYRPRVRQRIQNRRDVLSQAIQSAGRVFSVRETIMVLRAKGFKVSIGTACADLRSFSSSVQFSMLERIHPYSKFKHEKLNTLERMPVGTVKTAAEVTA